MGLKFKSGDDEKNYNRGHDDDDDDDDDDDVEGLRT